MKRARTGSALTVRSFTWRLHLVGLCLAVAGIVLLGRAVHLQVFNKEFLNEQAAARHLRIAKISAHRGPITDRNLAFAFVKPEAAVPGTKLQVIVFGEMHDAKVLAEPVFDPQNALLRDTAHTSEVLHV